MAGVPLLALFTMGHVLVEWALKFFAGRYSENEVIIGIIGLTLLVTSLLAAVLLCSICRSEIFRMHRYCPKCAAVDQRDERKCPVCGVGLTDSDLALFFHTSYQDERDLSARFGLTEAKEAAVILPHH